MPEMGLPNPTFEIERFISSRTGQPYEIDVHYGLSRQGDQQYRRCAACSGWHHVGKENPPMIGYLPPDRCRYAGHRGKPMDSMVEVGGVWQHRTFIERIFPEEG